MTKADREKLESIAEKYQCSMSTAMVRILREYGDKVFIPEGYTPAKIGDKNHE